MKKLTLFSVFCFMAISVMLNEAFAQAPQSFNYQLVARDTSGTVFSNRIISLQISLLKDSESGLVEYSERHLTITNKYGLVNIGIGIGNIISGNFQTIDWGSHTYFVKLEIDPVGGTNYFTMGITQLMSVPYSLYAEKAGNVVDTSNTNELQTLSISHDTIYLSNGGFAKLPPNVGVWALDGNNVSNNNTGFVGIGTNNPTSALHVNGSVRITDESEGNGKVLTSDPLGNASWQAPSSGNVSGTANYVPKFTSPNSIGNSMVYETNNKMGIGTQTPTGRLVIKGDSLANDSLPLFEVQDKNGKTVFVVWPDGAHVYVNDTSTGKANNKGSFAVSGKSTAKGAASEVFVVKPNDIHIYLDEAGAGKANNKGSFAVSGKSTAKGATNDYLSVNSDSIKVSKSFYLPRLTTLERDSLGFTPSEALIIFNTTDECMEIYKNGRWSNIWCFNCAPSIIQQAVNASICSSGDTSFSVSATGVDLIYQWQESSDGGNSWIDIADGGTNPVYSNATTNVISMSNIPAYLNSFKYRCVVNGSCNPNAISDAVTLNISTSNLNITSQPENKVLLAGCNTSFSIVNSAYGLCQWQKSTNGGSVWNNVVNGGTSPVISGTSATNLYLSNIPLSYNAYLFRCFVTNLCGTGDTSNNASLTVNANILTATNATFVAYNSFSANWNAVPGATSYYLDVSESSNFSSFLTGFNNLFVNSLTTFSIAGLSHNTTYYYRIRANNFCRNENSNTISVTTLQHFIGENYGGGKVFYFDGTGLHGLIAATSDQSASAQWGCYGTAITGADGTAIGTGSQNTIDIVAGCGELTDKAARLCSDLVLNGYSDWFLPSKDELNILYINRALIGVFASNYYWSSSETGSNNAFYQGFNNGFQIASSKNNIFYVRAVRAF